MLLFLLLPLHYYYYSFFDIIVVLILQDASADNERSGDPAETWESQKVFRKQEPGERTFA